MKRIFALALSGLLLGPVATTSAIAQGAAKKTETTTAKPKRPMSAGLLAARERQKKCGAEWREAKAAGTTAKGQKWPQFWSACNKRLKAQGA
jgi:hypothetical protein